jgi:hypothetical protein
LRTKRSMQARNAASVLPDPVGAEISVVRPARMCGQPCSWGSVGVPKRWTNHSCSNGWAQDRELGTGRDIPDILSRFWSFVKCSPLRYPLCRTTLNRQVRKGGSRRASGILNHRGCGGRPQSSQSCMAQRPFAGQSGPAYEC